MVSKRITNKEINSKMKDLKDDFSSLMTEVTVLERRIDNINNLVMNKITGEDNKNE